MYKLLAVILWVHNFEWLAASHVGEAHMHLKFVLFYDKIQL